MKLIKLNLPTVEVIWDCHFSTWYTSWEDRMVINNKIFIPWQLEISLGRLFISIEGSRNV